MTSKLNLINRLEQRAEQHASIDDALARDVLELPDDQLPRLLACTDALRRDVFGHTIRLCSIMNARSGLCQEDCRFCAQSLRHADAPREVYAMRSAEEILTARQDASQHPIEFFSIVTSGGALPSADLETAIDVIRNHPDGARWCASLGCLGLDTLRRLRDAGLVRYHHNLETGPSFYPSICSTQPYERRLATLRAAKEAGLAVCSGGIFGLGESLDDRVQLARTLREEQVDSIPLNFLIPIPGTPLADQKPMRPGDILRTIAMFRLVNPRTEIRVAGGRLHLRRLQPLLFWAGANGVMIGDLLTTPGEAIDDDLAMLADLGLTPSAR